MIAALFAVAALSYSAGVLVGRWVERRFGRTPSALTRTQARHVEPPNKDNWPRFTTIRGGRA